MEQNLSWKKAYLASALLHVVIAVLFAIGLAEIVAEKEQQTYVVDLAASNFSQGSGHEGGGGGAAAFPEPLKEEEVAKRVETVQQVQTQPQPILPDPAAVKTPEAVTVPDSVTSNAPATGSTSSSSAPAATAGGSGEGTGEGTGTGSGTGSGSGAGAGSGTGDGQGSGEGSGAGQGSGDGNISGTGTSPFDAEGFRAAIDANKQYPYMAIKRRLEGSVSIICTIDTSGSIVSVSLGSSSGSDILDDAALEAARAVGSFPNPSGKEVTVSTPVNFNLN